MPGELIEFYCVSLLCDLSADTDQEQDILQPNPFHAQKAVQGKPSLDLLVESFSWEV